MHVALEGDFPAALDTPSGIVSAPDPRRLPSPADAPYAGRAEDDTFTPDRDTRRPEVAGYDDPFTPSTAPFKRLETFDAVHDDYRLYVRDERLVQLLPSESPGTDTEPFYADLVADVAPDRSTRIPSVGPGARIVRARLGVGTADVALRVMHDGADNWFLEAPGMQAPFRGRLVMELAVPRATFGGPLADPAWSDLPFVAALPENVARDAAVVRAAVGVDRRVRPREAIAKLVSYFREFSDSDEVPRGLGSVYLDLALSKKGVCRHRAFAFLVTAQSLGIATRMVLNEAHAWVEVHDGTLWRRIDLGGAGRMTDARRRDSKTASATTYQPPPDAFAWPPRADRGDELAAEARQGSGATSLDPRSPPPDAAIAWPESPWIDGPDGRTPTELSLFVASDDAHRGAPLSVHGEARSDGDACEHVSVELWLRDAKGHTGLQLGRLATRVDGSFTGSIVVPSATPLGDYDVIARTPGDARCGLGETK